MTPSSSLEADELVTFGLLRAELAELREEMAAMERRLTSRALAMMAAQTVAMFAGFALFT